MISLVKSPFVTKRAFFCFKSMIVVLPTDTAHELKFIPRYFPTGSLKVELYNEAKKTFTEVTNTYTLIDGILSLSFEFNFKNKDKFQIKVEGNSGIVFRGKIICTSQTPQNFKQTQNLYFYE